MKQKEKIICPHYSRILLYRNLPKLQEEIAKLQVQHKKQQIKCQMCNSKLDQPNLCLKCQAPLCQLEKSCVFDHQKNNGLEHSITINIFSTVIVCVVCKVEILDFEQYGLTGNEEIFNQWINPQRIRIEFHRYFYKAEINHLKLGSQHVGILNIANSSYMNAVLQVMLNIPTVQSILCKINQEFERQENKNHQLNSKSVRKALLRQLCHFANVFKEKTNRIINPTELIKIVAQIDLKLVGYGRKEVYDFFKFLINFLHEEFRFTNLTKYQTQNLIVNQQAASHDWDIISQPMNYKDYSFIQNMFSGELLTNIQCQNCKKVTQNRENYSALSLEIPDTKNSGFLNKLVWGLKTGIGKERASISLMECLEFFYEPLFDPQVYCQCGSKGCKRTYRFAEQSNILCIHFQRFQNKSEKDVTHIQFPIQTQNFQSYFNMDKEIYYQLMAIIIHNRSGCGDHYETIIRMPKQDQQNGNPLEDQFISIKDEVAQVVPIKYVQEAEATMLFYVKTENLELNSIKHNLLTNHKLIEDGEIVLKQNDAYFLPNFWYEQFVTLSTPPPIITTHLLCEHQNLRPDYWDFRQSESNQTLINQSVDLNTSFTNQLNTSIYDSNNVFFPQQIEEKGEQFTIIPNLTISSAYSQLQLISILLPKEICSFLIEKFGGGPAIPKSIQTCSICLERAQIMSKRRKLERALINKYESYSDNQCRIINEEWIKNWQNYLYHSKIQLQKNYILGYPLPGKIKNDQLLDSNQQMAQTNKEGIHYRIITKPIWKILQLIYGGGPELKFQDSNEIFRLESEDQQLIQDLKSMAQQCQSQATEQQQQQQQKQ